MGTKAAAIGWLFVLLLSYAALGQTKRSTKPRTAPVKKPTAVKAAADPAVKVTLVDEVALRKVLVPNGKPLLVNFWATWCDPCREEFPDLVKIDNEFKGKIDFVTVSLDDPEEIITTVPKFLAAMKAEMPAYLLKTADESAVIASISKAWQGGMPFTALYGRDGKLGYFREGKIIPEKVRSEISKLIVAPAVAKKDIYVTMDFVKIKDGKRDETIYFYENNWKLYRDEAKKRGFIDSYELIETKSEKHADFDLILITRYNGEEQMKNSEKNFEPILKELRPNGPALKNAVQPADFRVNVSFYTGRPLLSAGN